MNEGQRRIASQLKLIQQQKVTSYGCFIVAYWYNNKHYLVLENIYAENDINENETSWCIENIYSRIWNVLFL